MSTPPEPLLIPVGQFVGAYYDGRPDGEHFFQVRIGPDIVRLDDDQFVVWGLTHGGPDRNPDQPWTAQDVLTAARGQGMSAAPDILAGLRSDYLVFEVAPGTPGAVDFARRHRFIPLMLGLGNSPDDPRMYSVGLPGQPIVSMSSTAYDLYEWAHLDPDLWTACKGAAGAAARAGVTDLVATDPARMLDALLSSVHTFLSPNAVYFDTRGQSPDSAEDMQAEETR